MSKKWGFPVGSDSKESATTQETQVQSLGQEDPLEKEMETHSSILEWRSPWTEEPGRLQSIGSQESATTEMTKHACSWILDEERLCFEWSLENHTALGHVWWKN